MKATELYVFYINDITEGAFGRSLLFLSQEYKSGLVTVSFGDKYPPGLIAFVDRKVVAAEFGSLKGEHVLDLMLCHERGIKEIKCEARMKSELESSIKEQTFLSLLAKVSRGVDKCSARPLIYGLMSVHEPEEPVEQRRPLLQMIHEFGEYRELFESIPSKEWDHRAPLSECVLIRRALASHRIKYWSPLIPLKAFRPMLELVQPLEHEESENLRRYHRQLLPNPRASHMPIEPFYAFASAIESIAFRRGEDVGEQARRIIYEIIQKYGNDGGGGLDGALVPADRGPAPSSGYYAAQPTEDRHTGHEDF